MNKQIEKDVTRILENYPQTQRNIELLRFELKHPQHINLDELIHSMNFAHGNGGQPSAPGHISNKTMYIAMNYQEIAAAETQELIDSIAVRLYPLERESERLHYYMKLLSPQHQMVIELYYFQQHSWDEIATMKDMAPRTAQRLRQNAVTALAEMYAYVDKRDEES